MRFEDGRVSGSDGCNRFSVPYTQTGSALQVSASAALTRMACPPEVMQQGEAVMSALTVARSYRMESGRLSLLAEDGSLLMTMEMQVSQLAGSSWRVTGYNNGTGGVSSVAMGTSVTLSFSADGRANGSAGCNNYTAQYMYDEERLTFGPAAATKRLCMSPAGVMEQEQAVLRALETVATARFEGDRLELRSATGALVLSLLRS